MTPVTVIVVYFVITLLVVSGMLAYRKEFHGNQYEDEYPFYYAVGLLWPVSLVASVLWLTITLLVEIIRYILRSIAQKK